MRRWTLLIALLVTMPCLAATHVYRWTDSHGIAHFSDAPPPQGVKYKVVDLVTGAVSNPAPAASAPAAASTATTADASANPPAVANRVPDTPQNRTNLCQHLKKNIALLGSDQLLTTGPDSTTPLPATERAKRLAAARATSDKYCATE